MNETVAWYGTVAQYVQVVQQNQVSALAVGVVVHQHTHVLMVDLHERGNDMSVPDVQAGIQKLTAELATAYKAVAVGDLEIQRVVEQYKSGPQGKAAVNTRVTEANARMATTLCDCAVCEGVAVRVRPRVGMQQWLGSRERQWRFRWAQRRRGQQDRSYSRVRRRLMGW